MNKRFVLWGRKPDEKNWSRKIITETEDSYRLKKLVIWAKESNYIDLEITVFNVTTGEFMKKIIVE
jgi:hypothetical protein